MENVREALESNKDAQYLLFLGDGVRLMERLTDLYPQVAFLAVRGNCDFFDSDYPYVRTVGIKNVKIYMCHGHTCGMGHGVSGDVLSYNARKEGCAIALYGHTHLPYIKEEEAQGQRFVLFNPGSISEPRGGNDSSYGVLTVKDGGFELKHVFLSGN